MKYDKHIFVCANQKAPGKKCCGETFGLELVQALRDKIKAADLQINVRAQRAGCLDVCGQGPALVIYPEGVFYGKLTLEAVDQIVDRHLAKNEIVTEFVLLD